MRISSKVKAKYNIAKRVEKFQVEILAGQVQAVREGVFAIHNEASKSLQENTDGTPVIRYGPKGKRIAFASNPGDPPNTDTGRAVKSIKFDFQKSGLVGRVGTNLKYLAALEFGTKRIAARPWLSRAVAITSKHIGEIFKKALKDSIKGVK